MKAAAIILIVLCLITFSAVGYLYMNANVSVTAQGVSAAEAVSDTAAFDLIRRGIIDNTLSGTVFSENITDDIGSYIFDTYRITITNNTFVNIELPEMTIIPFPSDIAGLSVNKITSVAPWHTEELAYRVLSGSSSGSSREVSVSWYIFGIPFSVVLSCGSR